MYATTILAWVFVHIGFFIAFPALWLLWRAFAPGWTGQAESAVAKRPIVSFLVGLPVALVWVVIGVAMTAGGGVGGFFAAVALAAFFLYANAGLSGVVTWLGGRLPSPADAERPWKATLRGGLALEFTFMLPLLGWLFILPVSLITGAGAATIGLVKLIAGSQSEAAPSAPSAPAVEAPAAPAAEAPAPVSAPVVDHTVPAAAVSA
jgi:hypothetical protein